MTETRVTILSIIIYTLGALFLCYEMALQVSPSIMTEHLMRDLHTTAAGLGIISGVYFYTYTAMQIPAGLLFDRFSTRHLTTLAIIVCVLGALLFAMTNSLMITGMGRMLMGAGSACAFIAVLVIAARWFPPTYFALLVGVAQLLAALGAYGGTEPLAKMVSAFGWRDTINYMSFFGFVLALVTWLVIKNKRLDTTQTQPEASLPVGESLQQILRNKQTWWIGVYAFCSWAPITVFPALWGVPYMMKAYGMTAIEAGYIVGMIWLGLGFISPFLGWLSDRIGRRALLMDITALIGLAASIIILFVADLSHWQLLCLMLCFGIATSGQIISFAVVKDINQSNVTATAIGVNNMAVVAPGAILQPLTGVLLHFLWDGSIENAAPVYSLANYQVVLAIIPLCFLVGWLVRVFFIKETYCQALKT